MKRTNRPLIWFRFEDEKNELWEVYLTDGEISPGEVGWVGKKKQRYIYGITYWHDRVILLDAGQSKTELRETFLHELAHVGIGGHRATRAYDRDENWIERVSPLCGRLMVRWPWPALPKGYERLKRGARRRHALLSK